MEWFSGNIAEAIQLAKRRGSIFIVYITGEDEATKEMDTLWEDKEIDELCQQKATVAIKIKANSEACTFFSQIYPVVLIPSAYFIGNNGTPLEVLGGSLNADNFKQKVKTVLEKDASSDAMSQPAQSETHQQQAVASASSAQPQEASTSSDSFPAAAAAEEAMPPEKKVKTEEINSRVEKAKALLEQKRVQKAQEEAEKEHLKEMERRKMGQNLQQLKQFQQEREFQEVKEQLKKEKEEEKQARERIKQQIERDRAERSARFNKEKTQMAEQQETAKRAKLLEQQQAAADAEARRSEMARIQFRLADGSSISNQFRSTDPLQTAYDFIEQRIGESVTLSTAYPRRTFSQSELAASFMDLRLAPTAVLLVVPATGALGGSPGWRMGGMLSVLLAPFMMVWNFIMSFFIPRSPISYNSNTSAGSSSTTSAAGGDRSKASTTRKRIRQEGNVSRLKNDDDEDDDENATWNGNSTQQM